MAGMQIYKRIEEEEQQVQFRLCNILARQYENFKILVHSPTIPYHLWVLGIRILKFQCCQAKIRQTRNFSS